VGETTVRLRPLQLIYCQNREHSNAISDVHDGSTRNQDFTLNLHVPVEQYTL